jgi:nucleotide-binding universal stress UspA family protein
MDAGRNPGGGRSDGAERPALLCYDGSDAAKHAIDQAGAVLAGGPAVVLCVWESLGSAVLRYPLPGATELGRELREVRDDVVEAFDADVAEKAEVTAAEGAELAGDSGFDARPLARRALGRTAERTETTVWQAVVAVAEEEDVGLVVLGTRGRSGVRSALLGSVSYGVVHNCARPLLIVPPAE